MKHMKTISRSGRFFLHGLHVLHGEAFRTAERAGPVASVLFDHDGRLADLTC